MNQKKEKIIKTPNSDKEGKLIWDESEKTNPYKVYTYTDPLPEDPKKK